MANSREISHQAFHLLQVVNVSKRQKLGIYCIPGIAVVYESPGFEFEFENAHCTDHVLPSILVNDSEV